MVTRVIRLLIILVLSSIILGQSNPIDIGSAGARQLRTNGYLNVSHNPAALGYLAMTEDVDVDTSIIEGEGLDSLNIKKDDLMEDIVEENTADTSAVDSEFDEFSEFDDDQSSANSLIIEEVETEEIDNFVEDIYDVKTDSLVSDEEISYPKFSMSLVNVSLGLGSGVITSDWISNQLFGARDLREPSQLSDFLRGISDDVNLQVPIYSSLPLLNFSFGSNIISLGQVHSHTSVNIPSGLTKSVFTGIANGEELDISSLDIRHITYLPISFSKGFVLNPGLIPFGKKSYEGVRASLLVGLAELHTKSVSGRIKGMSNSTSIDMDLEINNSLLATNGSVLEVTPNISFGIGLNAGVITEIDEKLTIGLNIDNLFASIHWESPMIYTASINGEFTPKEISEADSLSELVEQSEQKETGSYTTSLPTYINFSGSYNAKEWMILDANLRVDFGDTYWASDAPTFSFGSEFLPNSKAPIFLGISIGGNAGFNWGAGISLKMGSFIMDIAGGQEGGMFNSATGLKAGIALKFEK